MPPDDRPVIFIANAASGRGRAAEAARLYARALERAGIPVIQHDLRSLSAAPATPARAFVVFGGDGSVHSAAPFALRADAPLFHVPFGTENLFARTFGMRQSFDALFAALAGAREARIDTALCNDRPFVLMTSAGPDASVVHRVARRRNGSISHLTYAAPILAEALRPALPPLRITVDGAEVVSGERGLALVANCPQYALRLNPAHDADPADARLDLVFLPARSAIAALAWGLRLALGQALQNGRIVRRSGASVRIESLEEPAPVQIDGEAPPADASAAMGASGTPRLTTPVAIEVRPASLRVLLPAPFAG